MGSSTLRLVVFVQSIVIGWWLLQHYTTLFLKLHQLHQRNITKENQQLQYQQSYDNNTVKNRYQRQVGGDIRSFELGQVRLSENSYHWQCMDSNAQYLMNLDPDRLLYVFRENAGLSVQNAEPFNGTWEAPHCELRGHFVGHYLSALAMLYQSLHQQQVHQRLMYMVLELKKVQESLKEDGYLSAFPSSQLDTLEALKPVWAPYYTLHKILVGLLDAYQLAGVQEALPMAIQFADYIHVRVSRIYKKPGGPRKWILILEVEFGGMNDVMYRIYDISGDEKHLWLAQMFDKPSLYEPLLARQDPLDGLHANTHIPQVLGLISKKEKNQQQEEVGQYRQAVEYFFHITTEQHGYSTGGTSVGEHWRAPYRAGEAVSKASESSATQESCTSYNMLKLAREIFKWSGRASLVDYYERLLINGVLSVTKIDKSAYTHHHHHHHHHHNHHDHDHHHHHHHHSEEKIQGKAHLTLVDTKNDGQTLDENKIKGSDRLLMNVDYEFDYRQVHRNLGARNTPLSIQSIVSSDNGEFNQLIYNGSTEEPGNDAGPGVYLYLLPLGVANRKDDSWSGWGFPYGSFWCCYGTAIESFAKLQDSLFFWRDSPDKVELFINQFVSSTLDWHAHQISVRMQSNIHTTYENNGYVNLQMDVKKKINKQLVLQLRIPEWVDGGFISYNNRTLNESDDCIQHPSSYCQIEQNFLNGDTISILFGLGIRTEKIQDTRQSYQGLYSILIGPHVMVGVTQHSKAVAGHPSDVPNMVQTINDEVRVYRVKLQSIMDASLQLVLHRNYLYAMDTRSRKFSNIESTVEFEEISTPGSCQNLLLSQQGQKNLSNFGGGCQVRMRVMCLPGAWLSVGSTGFMYFTYISKKASIFTVLPGETEENTIQLTILSVNLGAHYMSLYFDYEDGNNSVLGCQDFDERCSSWTINNECTANQAFMLVNCRKSCGYCSCEDEYEKCSYWSKTGECENNPKFMLQHCPLACGTCGGIRMGMTKTNRYINATLFKVSQGEAKYPFGSKILVPNKNQLEDENQFKQQQYLLIPLAYVTDERYTVYFQFEENNLLV